MTDERDSITTNYDAVAAEYAEHLYDELDRKPLDRHLLDRFAEEVVGRGVVADIGCGPGHVARYLRERGVDAMGIDLSPEMVALATQLNDGIEFRTGDMRHLDLADESLAGIIAFYSIVHLEPAELEIVFREFRRTLADGGLALVAFHVGDHTLHVDDLWGKQVCLDFRFLSPTAVTAALVSAGLSVIESTEREPYEGAEHPSRRCYLLARAS